MPDQLTLASAADLVRAALAAVDVSSLCKRRDASVARRELIQSTAAAARERLAEITQEAEEAERVGVERYDQRRAGEAFAALIGDIEPSSRRSGAELVRERDELKLALRGERAALESVGAGEQRVKDDARSAIAAASAPLLDFVRAELPKRAAALAELYAIAAVAAQANRGPVDEALTEATAHLRGITGAERPVPGELLAAFCNAGELLAFARMSVPDLVHVRRPASETVVNFRNAA